MSQDKILKILKEKKEPLTSKELAEYINIRQQNILSNLRRLIKAKEIKFRKPTKKELYNKGYKDKKNINNRMRVFYLNNP